MELIFGGDKPLDNICVQCHYLLYTRYGWPVAITFTFPQESFIVPHFHRLVGLHTMFLLRASAMFINVQIGFD